MSTETDYGEGIDEGRQVTHAHRASETVLRTQVPPQQLSAVRGVWERRYALAVAAVDVVAISSSVALHAVWGEAPATSGTSLLLGAVALLLTLSSLAIVKAWEPSTLGHGSEEFSRLLRGTAISIVALGLFGLAMKVPAVRPWVFGVLPVAGLLSAMGRLALRRRLHRRRRRGACTRSVLAIGSEEAVAKLVARTRQASHHGWVVTGACTPTGSGTDGSNSINGVAVLGDLDSAPAAARSGQFRIVSVSAAPGWSPRRLHHLAWDLEGSGAELVVDPGLMDVAGPRLHVAVVDGLPLLKLTEPAFVGLPWLAKAVVDRLCAALLLALLTPVLLAVAVGVRLDGGPALFRQVRVGQHGKPFAMLKFRSMFVDAEDRRPDLVSRNEGAGPLFKMRNDPRVTRVGGWLRRYSLDELPQLLNVIKGDMSLVGPRPPLPEEVRTYARDAQRKLMVRPGVTGLWQISGRSDLTWEESVRLDLRYVENWSLALDALILWKTAGAVIRGGGAY